jgi:type II secretion system protein N
VPSKKRMIVQGLAYAVYGIVVLLVILYWTFPYELIGKRLTERFSQGDLQLVIARYRPSFPPGLQMQQVRLLTTAANPPTALLQADTLQAQPDLLALFSKSLDIRLDGVLYRGQMHGNVQTAMQDSAASWKVQARFDEMHLEQSPLLQKDGKAFLRGRLGGDLSVTVSSEGELQQGTLNLNVKPMTLVSEQGLQLPLPRDITCETVQSQLSMAPGQLQIGSFTCRGDDLTVQAKGSIAWKQPLPASVLDLRIEIRSENAYKQELELLGNLVKRRPTRGALTFSLRGTLQEPRPGV